MRFLVSLSSFLAVTSTATALLLPRDGNTIVNDILGIDAAVRNLTATLNAYNGGILQSTPVFAASTAIHAVNRKGFADAVASGNFTMAQSANIAHAVTTTVAISIPNAVDVMEAKKPLFDDAQVSSIVLAFIELLRYDHDTFSLAVGVKLTAAQVEAAAGAAKIDAVLAGAETYYAV